MYSITAKQIATVARLQACAAQTYNNYDYPRPYPGDNPVSIAALTDSHAVDGAGGVLATSGGPLSRAIVVAIRYIAPDWSATDEPTQVPVIVLPDGTPIGAPFDLTREITITAPLDGAYMDADTPLPHGSDLEGPLRERIAERLSMLASSEYERAYKSRQTAI